MEYRLNKDNYCDFNVYEWNKLPPRSYFIPYPTRTQADAVSLKEKRYQSEKVLCLNGGWDFHFFPRPAELPDILDTDEVDFDTIDVPSCWQFRGYAKPFYVNFQREDQALCSMKHREDEKRTGTYVTIQAFQQGIGTGACGPAVMPEFQYPAKQDYELKFLIRVKIDR